MFESAAPKTQPEPNLGDLVEDALVQAKTLVSAELSLARAELKSELKQTLGSAVALGVGVMFLQAALVTSGVLLVLALGPGIGAVLVVGVLFAIAIACGVIGLRALQHQKLPRTTARLSTDAKQVLETVK